MVKSKIKLNYSFEGRDFPELMSGIGQQNGRNKWENLAIVLATFAGMLMVAAAMFFAIAQVGMINNNNIGVEEAKFQAEHNASLRSYGELNSLVPANNLIAKKYGYLALGAFALSMLMGVIAIILAYPRK